MLNLTNYQKAGYGAVFVETMEIKRAMKSIQIGYYCALVKRRPHYKNTGLHRLRYKLGK